MVANDILTYPLLKLSEPNFMPKAGMRFDVPVELIKPKYKDIAQEIEGRMDQDFDKIPLKSINLPEIKIAKNLSKNAVFSVFNRRHQEYSNELVKIFLDCQNSDELLSTAIYIRDLVNPYLFTHAYSVALAHRPDTKHIQIPSLIEMLPERVLTRAALADAKEESFVLPEELRRPIDLCQSQTGTEKNPEQRMAYFREDLGVNSHHFHWHVVYTAFGPMEIVSKDRRGELFYYMHQQILARYNIDRMCNDLQVVKALDDLTKPLATGYYPRLTALNASRIIVGRPNNVVLRDLRGMNDFPPIKVSDIYLWTNRIKEGIQKGNLIDPNGNPIPINNDQGINILGNTIEDSAMNAFFGYYGSIHGMGHMLIAMCHDPENIFDEQPGVMADTTTAMRDPIFYQWHTFVNSIFLEHKMTLPAYSEKELGFTDVFVENVQLIMNNKYVEQLETFWQKSEVNMARGLDFARPGAIRAYFRHLNHERFKYKIKVQNKGTSRHGTCRIFIMPVLNDRKVEYGFEGARKLAVEIDRFIIKLNEGENVIYRESEESVSVVPFAKIFPPIEVDSQGTPRPSDSDEMFCSCGWPDYLLIPKGTTTGYPCNLFVMISDFEQDKIIQDISDTCVASSVFCGLRDKLYPDKRPMGFPFDKPSFVTQNLNDFKRDNMFIKRITIKHFDVIKKYYKADTATVVPDPTSPEESGTAQSGPSTATDVATMAAVSGNPEPRLEP